MTPGVYNDYWALYYANWLMYLQYFCEEVMLHKETVERVRERADPNRRRQRKGRGRGY